MLPIEYVPSPAYMEAYREALKNFSGATADAVGRLSQKIIREKGPQVVLVSLARAGIPIGILIKRYIRWRYGIDIPHYSISIIRGRGIDGNAVRYILDRHDAGNVLFVDGWIGKGAIKKELENDIRGFSGLSPELAAAADPANITNLCGTHEDILIPSSCLNCTVSGLISRTFLRDDIIGPEDFHGAAYYGEWKDKDLSYGFIDAIQSRFAWDYQEMPASSGIQGADEVGRLAAKYGVDDINLVKPGIGETTRVLLRRVPWKILVDRRHRGDVALEHILRLAAEKEVPVEYEDMECYKICGIIRKMADA